MASSGPFLLLLMLVSFPICSQSAPQGSEDQEHHVLIKRENRKKPEDVKMEAKDIKNLVIKAEPFISLIPKAGPFLGAFINVFLKGEGDTDKIIRNLKTGFKDLNKKLDNQLITTTWNIWASGPYQEAESNIRLAWKNLIDLLEKCKNPCFSKEQKERNMNVFKELHANLVFAPDKLHMLLTTQQPTFMTDFEALVTDHARCHEDRIEGFVQLISALMYMSNTVNVFYYSLHGIDKAEEMARMTFEMMSFMSKVQMTCILNPEKYIEKDVIDLIDENQDRQQLAKDIKVFLDKTYSLYDWLVVAFITRNSRHTKSLTKFRNRHNLEGFTEVTKGEVSVAVAKQIKGSYNEVQTVIKDIEKCFTKSNCEDVIKKLKECKDLSDKYTAVHAYRRKSHDSAESDEDEFIDGEDNSIAGIYTAGCAKMGLEAKKGLFKGGHFRVMIKSDEELNKNKNLCQNVNCGESKQGKCDVLKNVQKAICLCNEGYTGSNCEISQKEFIEAIRKGIGLILHLRNQLCRG
uniref:EGF-like domain-containing protein n=1 Tax=Cyprinodon variegatus TaxID=28743 RepID=A0A3Q2CJD2_CYPVA